MKTLCYFLLTLTLSQAVRVTDHVYLKVKVGEEPLGKMVIALFGETVPKTVANFKGLCLQGDSQGRSYNGSTFHRVVKHFVVQGGDIVRGDGHGVTSIYGDKPFDDENFELTHAVPGIVNMANQGPNTNGCQFAIVTIRTPKLDGKRVVFGKVVQGYDPLVTTLEYSKTDAEYRPLLPLVITECGLIPLPKGPYDLDVYADSPMLSKWFFSVVPPLCGSLLIVSFFHRMAMSLETSLANMENIRKEAALLKDTAKGEESQEEKAATTAALSAEEAGKTEEADNERDPGFTEKNKDD